MAAKVWGGVLIGVAGAVLSAGLLAYVVTTTGNQLAASKQRLELNQAASASAVCVSRVSTAARGILSSWNVLQERRAFEQGARGCRQMLETLRQEVQPEAAGAGSSVEDALRALDVMVEHAGALWPIAEEHVNAQAEGRMFEAQAATERAIEQLQLLDRDQATAAAALRQLQEQLTASTAAFFDTAQRAGAWLRGASLVAILLALAASMLVGFWFSRALTAPLRRLTEVGERIAQGGSLSEDVTQDGTDEVGRLSGAFGAMLARLRGTSVMLLEQMGGVSTRLAGVGLTVGQAAKAVRDTVARSAALLRGFEGYLKDVGLTAQALSTQVNHGTQAARHSVLSNTAMAASVDQMQSGVEDSFKVVQGMVTSLRETSNLVVSAAANAHNAELNLLDMKTANAQMLLASSTVTEGWSRSWKEVQAAEKQLTAALDGMRGIRDATTRAAHIVAVMDEKARTIPMVLGVIDRVGKQINLLALNASILAAQSGAHGAAFGVVAEEINDLARGTAASTREIGLLVEELTQKSQETAQAVQTGATLVEQGARQGERAREALNSILDHVRQSGDAVAALGSAAQGQHQTVERAAEAVRSVLRDVANAASRVGDQTSTVERIDQSSHALKAVGTQVVQAARAQRDALEVVTHAMAGIFDAAEGFKELERTQGADVMAQLGALQTAMRSIAQSTETLSVQVAEISAGIQALDEQGGTVRRQIERPQRGRPV